MGKSANWLTTSVNREWNIQCLFPTIVSLYCPFLSLLVRAVFGTAPINLPLVPDCFYGVRAVFSVSSSGISLDIIKYRYI